MRLNKHVALFLSIIGPFTGFSAVIGLINSYQFIVSNEYLKQNLQYIAINSLCDQVISNIVFALVVSILLFLVAVPFLKSNKKVFWILPYVYIIQIGLLVSRFQYYKAWSVKIPFSVLSFPGFLWHRHIVAWTLGSIVLALLIATFFLWFRRNRATGKWLLGKFKRFYVWSLIIAFGIGISVKLATFFISPSKVERPFNIIWVSWDSARADHFSCYGYHRPTTPNVDAFARGAVQFVNVISQHNWTRPSYMSQFTSLPMWKFPDHASRYSLSQLTLAEILRNHGYRTIGIVQNPNLDSEFNMNQGFDSYFQLPGSSSPITMNKVALKALSKFGNNDMPFFLFLHIQQPHYPYAPDNPFRKEFVKSSQVLLDAKQISSLMHSHGENWNPKDSDADIKVQYLLDLYDMEIRYADEGFGRLIKAIQKLDLYDNSIIVINSDHGDEFADHGSFGHAHKNLHPELTFVPMVIRFPKSLDIPAKKVIGQVQSLDIFPTVLKALEIDIPDHIEGLSLLPLSESNTPARLALSKVQSLFSIRTDHYSLHIDARKRDQARFFDLNQDPKEFAPLESVDQISEYADLLTFSHQWIDDGQLAHGSSEKDKPKISKDLVEKLRGLGYVK